MDRPKATPKDFFLWAGAMIALYAGVFAFITLLFEYIDHVFRDDTLGYYWDPYAGGVAYAMSSLIVLAPVFLILMRVIRRSITADPSRGEVWVRRWALFLVLFVAGATIVIDLIVLLNTFLSGEELTARFLLKVLVVLLVAGAGFMHFIADLWGYWDRNPSYARMINWAVGALVVLTIAAGFLIVGSPNQQRAYRIDAERVSDLQGLQSQIIYVYQQKGALPNTLGELDDPLSYYTVPVDPESKQAYGYTVKGPLEFELCADFKTESVSGPYETPRPVLSPYGTSERWEHGAERTCFERKIDPKLYPLYPKPVR